MRRPISQSRFLLSSERPLSNDDIIGVIVVKTFLKGCDIFP